MGHACLKFDNFFVAVWVKINETQAFDKERIPFISTEGALSRPLTYDNHPIPSHPIPEGALRRPLT